MAYPPPLPELRNVTAEASLEVPLAVAPSSAVDLLLGHFLARSDWLAFAAPWLHPCPVAGGAGVEAMLLAHILGDAAPATAYRWRSKSNSGELLGRYRLGTYSTAADDTVRWLCFDFDGRNHANPLPDPTRSAIACVRSLDVVGIPAYLERSGSAMGWHVWVFFSKALAAAKARALGLAIASDSRVEVFPKQDAIKSSGLGNFVWLPWWSGAAPGGNQFYQIEPDGALTPFQPKSFETTTEEVVDGCLADQAKRQPPAGHVHISEPFGQAKSAVDVCQVATAAEKPVALTPVEMVLSRLNLVTRCGDGWAARCPAHNDQSPSLSVNEGTDGRVLLHCHAGCSIEKILGAVGLEKRDLFPKRCRTRCRKSLDLAEVDRRPTYDPFLAVVATRFERALSSESLNLLAEHLGLPAWALWSLSPGWLQDDARGPCWTIPEHDGSCRVIGIMRRYRDGTQRLIPGGRRGLYIPLGVWSLPGTVLCPEGASDTAALTARGLPAIGRPSNSGGVDLLAELFARMNREIIIIGENDQDETSGRWPGREGAIAVATKLSHRLGRSVRVCLPPHGTKDVRDLIAGALGT